MLNFNSQSCQEFNTILGSLRLRQVISVPMRMCNDLLTLLDVVTDFLVESIIWAISIIFTIIVIRRCCLLDKPELISICTILTFHLS